MTVIAIAAVTPSQSQATTAARFDAALDRAAAANDPSTTASSKTGPSPAEIVPGPDAGQTFGWGGSSLGQGRLECPSSIDLNGDGRIGLDELLVAMGLSGSSEFNT